MKYNRIEIIFKKGCIFFNTPLSVKKRAYIIVVDKQNELLLLFVKNYIDDIIFKKGIFSF